MGAGAARSDRVHSTQPLADEADAIAELSHAGKPSRRQNPRIRTVAQALEGEEAVIAKAGRPLIRLVPVDASAEVRPSAILRDSAVARAELKADFATEIDHLFG